jgi:hypothetical protein
MDCEDIQTHLPDHLTGALPASQADAVAAHLATCAMCAVEFEELGQTWERLGDLPRHRVDSAGMRARFDAAVEAQHGSTRRRLWPDSLSGYGLQFAAAAALLLLGIALGRQLAPPPAVDPQIAEMREELRDTREMVTLSLLQQGSASERLRGVSTTRQIDQPDVEITRALLDTLRYDSSVNVRLASIDALKRFATDETVRRGVIETLPEQMSPLVQIALIDFVVELNGRDAADTLRRLSTDPMVNTAVRRHAERSLAQMG